LREIHPKVASEETQLLKNGHDEEICLLCACSPERSLFNDDGSVQKY
jgi:hypothetical protein